MFNSLSKEVQREMIRSVEKGQHLYFILAVGLDLIKIGIAHSPHGRLKELQTASPITLELVYVVPFAGQYAEGLLHMQFKDLRQRGEWFIYGPPIKQVIEELKQITEEVGLYWDLREQKLINKDEADSTDS